MKILQKLLGSGIAPVAAERTAERYKQYRLLGKHQIAVSPPPTRMDECRAKLAAAAKTRDIKIDGAASLRDTRMKDAKTAYDDAIKEIERDHRQFQHKANVEFDEIEAKTLAEYAAPLSPEQVALLMTKPGEVVRVPSSAPSTALPQGA